VSSLFLTDETVGLALTQQAPAARTMAITGGLAYIAWVAGTAAGVAGASVGGAEEAADALFPVLFIGLAAVTASTGRDAVRAAGAGAAAAVLLIAAPAAGVLGAVAAAIVVAWVRARR
jgi:branched chain amino acid efflux pump